MTISKPFPFVDDDYARQENPAEVQITADNDRFPLLLPKPNVEAHSYTKSALKLADRVAEAANRGRSAHEHVTADSVPQGLLRAFEAADAATQRNVSNLSTGTLKTMSTDVGELLYVDVLVNPIALCHDPVNGRSVLESRIRRRPHVSASADHAAVHLPVFDMESSDQLIDMVSEANDALGFSGPTVDPGKDYQDLCSIGLQGIHEPILVLPVQYRCADESTMWVLVIYDGNRRVAMARRVLKEATGLEVSHDLEGWNDHLRTPSGSTVIRDMDADAVNALRRKAMLRDFTGGVWVPRSGRDEDINYWLHNSAARSIKVRSVTRCRTVPARLVLGFNAASVALDIAQNPSKSMALTQRIVRRLHIEEAAQKPWSEATQHMQVALEALGNAILKAKAGADLMPLTLSELNTVINNVSPVWAGTSDGPLHPLRLTAKVIAEIVCDEHDATAVVKDAMRAFNLSVHRTKLPENRAQVAAAIVMPLLGFSEPDSGAYKRTRAVIDRVFRNRVFTDVGNHPGSETRAWWELLDEDVQSLVAEATVELQRKADLPKNEAEEIRNRGTGMFGPSTRVLLALALIAQAANPAVAAPFRRVTASPFQITLNGLGGERGVTLTTPDLVLMRLCENPSGISQLGEIVRAGLATNPEIPRNVIDPDCVTTDRNGVEDPSTRGLLTEAFLRGEKMGWTHDGDNGLPPPPPTRTERYHQLMADIVAAISTAHRESRVLQPSSPAKSDSGDDGSFADLFREFGLAESPDLNLRSMLSDLTEIVVLGAMYARNRL